MVIGEYSEYSPAKACLNIETLSKLKFGVPEAGLQKTKKRLTRGSVAAGSSRRNSQRKEAYVIRIDIASLKLP